MTTPREPITPDAPIIARAAACILAYGDGDLDALTYLITDSTPRELAMLVPAILHLVRTAAPAVFSEPSREFFEGWVKRCTD